MFSTIEFYYEKTKGIMYASLAAALLNIILNYIFINIYGYIAAAYTTLFCYMMLSLAHYYFMKKIVKKYIGSNIEVFDLRSIIQMAILVLTGIVVFSFVYSNTVLRYGLIILLFSVCIIERKRILLWIKLVKK